MGGGCGVSLPPLFLLPHYLCPATTHQYHQPQLQQLRQESWSFRIILATVPHSRPEGHWHPPGFLLTLLPTPRAAPLTYSAGQGSRPTHLRRQNRHQGRNVLGPWNGAEVKPTAQDYPATALLLFLPCPVHRVGTHRTGEAMS